MEFNRTAPSVYLQRIHGAMHVKPFSLMSMIQICYPLQLLAFKEGTAAIPIQSQFSVAQVFVCFSCFDAYLYHGHRDQDW